MEVIILRGLPGSGKSWCAQQLKEEKGALVVSADSFFVGPDGVYKHDASKLGEAHACCFLAFLTAVRGEFPLVVVDNTNLTAWECSPYLLGAQAHGYTASSILTILCPLEVCEARQTHGVPASRLRSMMHTLSTTKLPPFWEQQVVDNDPARPDNIYQPRSTAS